VILKSRPHQQQYRSNIVECYKSNDSFDNVEMFNLFRLCRKEEISRKKLLRHCCWCGEDLIRQIYDYYQCCSCTTYCSAKRSLYIVHIYQRGRQCCSRVSICVCLSVCLFFRTISQNPMQLGSANLTYKCYTLEIHLFWCRKVKITSHKNSAGVGHSLHFCE